MGIGCRGDDMMRDRDTRYGLRGRFGSWPGTMPCAVIATALLCSLAASARAATWRWAHPRPVGVLTTEVLWTGQRFLAFGPNQLLESLDGRDWTELGDGIFPPVTFVGTSPPVTDAIVFGGRIVAVTDDTVQSSLDGVNWTAHVDFSWDRPCTSFGGVATDGRIVVAVGFACAETMGAYGTPMAYFSTDGAIWEPAVLPYVDWDAVNREELSDVTWDGRRFIAAGVSDCQPVLYTSPDGRQWSRTPGVGGTVAASGGGVALVGCWPRLWRSTDGEHWSESTLPDGSWWFNDVEWVRDRFIAAWWYKGVLTSVDGATWSFHALATDATLTEVATDGEGVVLGGRDFYFSEDYEHWTPWQTQRLTTATLRDVAVGLRRAVAVGDDGTVLTSSDGEAWTLAAARGTTLSRVAFGGGRWLALGYQGALWSDDSIVWHATPGLPEGGATDLAWGAGVFVAVTPMEGAYVSTDGVVWERGDPLEGYQVWTVSWTGSEFVASAIDEIGRELTPVFLHSRDGRTWRSTPAPDPYPRTSRVVGVGTREFVVCAGSLYSSENGESWTIVPMDRYLLDVDAVAGHLLATAQGDDAWDRQLWLSIDGASWKPVGRVPVGAEAFAALGARLIAVGSNGSIRYVEEALSRPPRRRLASLSPPATLPGLRADRRPRCGAPGWAVKRVGLGVMR